MADDRTPDAHPPTQASPDADRPAPPTAQLGAKRRALTAGLIALFSLVAIGVTTVVRGTDDSNPVDDVSAALAANAMLLAGPMNPTDLAHARCVQQQGTTFRCTPVINNAAATGAITVQWRDGVLSKRLAGSTLTSAPRAGDDVAQALIADERATIRRTLKYGCAFTSSMSPGGGPASGPGGFRCAAPTPGGPKNAYIQRYVEFAADGAVTRDFMLTTAN
jgi:hypothetical protein